MGKNIFIKIGIGLVIIISVWMIFSDTVSENLPGTISQPVVREAAGQAVLMIDYGEGESESFTVEMGEGTTAFDLLKDKTGELSINLETKSYDLGIFIEALGERRNGEDGKYWLYYINDEMPMTASDKQPVNSGDKIEFKFQRPSF